MLIAGRLSPNLGPLGSKWAAKARAEIPGDPGTPEWLTAALAWWRAHVRPGDPGSPPGHPAGVLETGRSWGHHQAVAFAWLLLEGFGVGAETRAVTHTDGSSHMVVLVGPGRWVADPMYGVIYRRPGGHPASLEELWGHPAWVAAARIPWTGRDGYGMEGFYATAATLEALAAAHPELGPKLAGVRSREVVGGAGGAGGWAELPPPLPAGPAPEVPRPAPVVHAGPPLLPGERPRVALVSDVPGWAFHVNMRDLERHCPEFECSHHFALNLSVSPTALDCSRFHVLFGVYWPFLCACEWTPWDRAVSALRSNWFTPGEAPHYDPEVVATVNRFRAFQVVTREVYALLKPYCPGMRYLTNPVDTTRFDPTRIDHRQVIAEWNGNPAHAGTGIKGVRVLEEACARAEVPFLTAQYDPSAKKAQYTYEEMPGFYAQASVAVCASAYEGASNATMEAMAAGLILITTDVGNHREMRDSQAQHLGDSGIILVDRSPDAFVGALARVKRLSPERRAELGAINAREIRERWSWPVWATRYAEFLRAGIEGLR